MTDSFGGFFAALAELTRFHWATVVSLLARMPRWPRVVLAEAHSWASVVTFALIQPSGCAVQAALPRVSVDSAFMAVIVGRLVHRLAVVAAGEDQTCHGWAAQVVLAEWKFHRLSLALVTRASAIGAVFQVMKDCAVRGVPFAFVVPGLPKSSSTSVDQSRVSPCWT